MGVALVTECLRGLGTRKVVVAILFMTEGLGTWHRGGAQQIKMKEQIIGLMDKGYICIM